MSSDYERMAGAYGRHRTAYEPLLRELVTGARLTEKSRVLEISIPVTSADVYEAKAFSSLHQVPEAAFQAGLRRLKAELARGPMVARGGFALLWATK